MKKNSMRVLKKSVQLNAAATPSWMRDKELGVTKNTDDRLHTQAGRGHNKPASQTAGSA